MNVSVLNGIKKKFLLTICKGVETFSSTPFNVNELYINKFINTQIRPFSVNDWF